MTTWQPIEAAQPQLRAALKRALREAIGQAPGNRAAALRRARDELLQLLRQDRRPDGEPEAGELAARSVLTTEIDAAAAEVVRELARRC